MSALLSAISSRLRGGDRAAPESEVQVVTDAEGADDGRLVALFRNRTELKKAFTRLQAECESLRAQLEGVGSESRDVERLAALEQRLSERETAYPAIAYYQLRGLWQLCHNLLVDFAEQLFEQHQAREYAVHEKLCADQRAARLHKLGERVQMVAGEVRRFEGELAERRTAHASLWGFWNHFQRRKLEEQIAVLAERVADARRRLVIVEGDRARAEAEPAAPFGGISTAAKRNVNLAVIAFAQYLYVQFIPNSLASLSHDAINRFLNEVHYGSQRDCEALMELVAAAVQDMSAKRGYGNELKLRARHLRRRAVFADEQATIPTVDCLAHFPLEFHDGHAGVQVDVNVLAADYWHLRRILLV